MSYKPYKVPKNNNIYSRGNRQGRNNRQNSLKDDRIKLFGFRSGVSYKMILFYIMVLWRFI